MLQFGRARVFEAEHLAALRIHAGHDVPDRTVFAGRVHGLKDQQHGVTVGGVKQLLLLAQLRNVVVKDFLIILLRLVDGIDDGGPFLEVDLVARRDAKGF